MTLGERIREARLKKGLTQEQLAEKIGVAKSTLTGYEKGNREPDVLKLQKLIDCLGVPSNYLLGFPDEFGKDSVEQHPLLQQYNSLDEHGKRMVDLVIREECRRMTFVYAHDDTKEAASAHHPLAATTAQPKHKVPTVAEEERDFDDIYAEDEILVRAAHRATRSIEQLNDPDSL